MNGLQQTFSKAPNSRTPLIGTIRRIYRDYIRSRNNLNDKQLLIIVITDGEPSDGTHRDLFDTLTSVTKVGNVHMSFAECTDNEEDMEYLD